jgi:hypothetical protein
MSFVALLISLLVVIFGIAILAGIIYLLMNAAKK